MRRLAYCLGTSFGGCCLRINYVCLSRVSGFARVAFWSIHENFQKNFEQLLRISVVLLWYSFLFIFQGHRKGALVFLRVFHWILLFYRICFVFFWPYVVAIILRVLLACRALWMWYAKYRRVLTKLLRCISPGHFEEQLCRTPYQTNHLIKKTGKQFSADAVCLYSAFWLSTAVCRNAISSRSIPHQSVNRMLPFEKLWLIVYINAFQRQEGWENQTYRHNTIKQ